MTLLEAFYRAVPSLRTVIIHHPDCLLHVPRMNGSQGANPWEAPARMDAILSELRTNLKDWEVAYDQFVFAGNNNYTGYRPSRPFAALSQVAL